MGCSSSHPDVSLIYTNQKKIGEIVRKMNLTDHQIATLQNETGLASMDIETLKKDGNLTKGEVEHLKEVST